MRSAIRQMTGFVVTRTEVRSADEVEQQLAAGLGERQIAEFVENDEVRPSQVIGEPALPAITGWACPQTGSRQGPWPAEVWRR